MAAVVIDVGIKDAASRNVGRCYAKRGIPANCPAAAADVVI